MTILFMKENVYVMKLKIIVTKQSEVVEQHIVIVFEGKRKIAINRNNQFA